MPDPSDPVQVAPARPDEQIAAELASLALRDQTVREQHPRSPEVDQVDRENSQRLKDLIVRIGGWPGISRFGAPAATAAWLIAHHADHDPAFQAECLKKMLALSAREVDSIDRAYLEDRIRVNMEQPQRYGTQWMAMANPSTDGVDIVPSRIEDPEHVDARRSAVGLPPLAVQKEQMRQAFSAMQPSLSPAVAPTDQPPKVV